MSNPSKEVTGNVVPSGVTEMLRAVRDLATKHDAFDAVELSPGRVVCHAEGAPENAFYRIVFDGQTLWGEWVSLDRYVSQSIEQVLVFTGDDLWDMIDEELVDFGWSQPKKLGPIEHFRNDDLEFVFRSSIPVDVNAGASVAADVARVLFAFEAAMCEMGDMAGDDEDE